MSTTAASAPDRYSATARLLHWVIAGLIVLQFVLANLAESAEDADDKFRALVLLANHKSVGLTILALAIVRLGWRLYSPPPAPLPMAAWQRRAAAFSHGAFYALLVLLPLSGWLMSSAASVSVSWFNLFQVPDLVGPNDELEDFFEEFHELLAPTLFVLALIHVAAALKHTLLDRDGALRRISSPASIAVFIAVLALGLFLLAGVGRAAETSANDGIAPGANAPPRWRIDADASYIRFRAVQAGARFEGEWRHWEAEIRFDPERLDDSLFDVVIDVASVATGEEERDRTLLEPAFFDAAEHPHARYHAADFSGPADGAFSAAGTLVIKDEAAPVELRFEVEREGAKRRLTGSARVDRLRFDVGTGDWSDTAWIGRYVDVSVRVEATVE